MNVVHDINDIRCFESMVAGERDWAVLSKQCANQKSKDFFSKVFSALQQEST